MLWEAGVVLTARKALFLRGSNNNSISDKSSRAVVIVSRDTENVHAAAPRQADIC